MRVAGLVLAAGASSRMGSPKALLPVDGRPAVECVAATLAAAGADPVIVVLGCDADRIRAAADLSGVSVVEHPGWKAGRTSSIQAGLAAVPAEAQGVLLAPVDIPLFQEASVRALVEALAGSDDAIFAVPTHGGRGGHPVLLGRALFVSIEALGPDEPLRELLQANPRLDVALEDEGVLADFNTPGDAADLA